MKTTLFIVFFFSLFNQVTEDKSKMKNEIFHTEKSFEKMVSEKGMAEAFYFFADDSAVIKRENDSLIIGKENIRKYYESRKNKNVTLKWAPDFIDVSDCGNLGYSYGKYVWQSKDTKGNIIERKGVFHTVWKRQADKSWKYVWD